MSQEAKDGYEFLLTQRTEHLVRAHLLNVSPFPNNSSLTMRRLTHRPLKAAYILIYYGFLFFKTVFNFLTLNTF